MLDRVAFKDFWPDFDSKTSLPFLTKYNWEIDNDDPQLVICSVFGKSNLEYNCPKLLICYENYYRWPHEYITNNANWILANNTSKSFPHFSKTKFYHSSHAVIAKILQGKEDRYHDRSFVNKINKRRFCSFVFNNGSADMGAQYRKDLFLELSRYKRVDSAGGFLNNMDGFRPGKEDLAWFSQYKFSISFENSLGEGYLTEKPFVSFAAGTVPIYWGHPSALDIINPKAIVWHEGSINDTVRKIIELDQDPEKYKEVLKEPSVNGHELPPCLDPIGTQKFIDDIVKSFD